MADRKITDLTALTTPASADVLPIVDVSEAAAADKNKKVTVGELFKGIPDGTAAAPAIAFESDDGNGFFLSTTDTIGIATNGVSRATVSTTAVTSTLPVIVPDGSAAAPSVAFTGSGTDTGLYSPGADQVAISTNGTGRLTIDSSGNVNIDSGTVYIDAANNRLGVGTTSPNALIQASGGSAPIVRVTDTRNTVNLDLQPANTEAYFGTQSNHPLAFQTNATERLRITSAGLVGIGTSSVTNSLHVVGTADTVARLAATSDTNLTFSETTANKHWNIKPSGGDFYFQYSGTAYNSGYSSLLTIKNTGAVGIGTTSPAAKLHIGGVSAVTDAAIYIPTGGIQGDNGGVFEIANVGNTTSELKLNTRGTLTFYRTTSGALGGGSEMARFDSSSRFLLGTSSTSTTTRALIQGNSSDSTGAGVLFVACGKSNPGTSEDLALLRFGDSGHARSAEIGIYRDGGTWTSGTSQPTRLTFSTCPDNSASPVERMRITSAGFVGIGTTNPGGTLAISSGGANGVEININETGSENRLLSYNRSTSTRTDLLIDSNQVRFATGSSATERLKINSGGDIFLISTKDQTTASGANTYVDATSGVLRRSTSSIKYKTDVETLQDSYANEILKCRPVWYRSTSNCDNQQWGYWGFIAEEVAEVDPRLCFFKENEDGSLEPEGVQYDRFVPHLLNLIKRQGEAIAELQAEVAALKAQ